MRVSAATVFPGSDPFGGRRGSQVSLDLGQRGEDSMSSAAWNVAGGIANGVITSTGGRQRGADCAWPTLGSCRGGNGSVRVLFVWTGIHKVRWMALTWKRAVTTHSTRRHDQYT